MSNELRFDGKVVIVTGAGGGLGRQYALMFGSRGARVVVNDLGGGAHGGGKSSAAADKVVDEIKALGSDAVANYDSVENGAAIVQTALENYGTVDIVVNNAGILRDSSFQKMTMEDWDLIMNVHLKGSMSVTHAAWPIMREKGYGRIIMTASAAGIYGNFGQTNYSAAKLGLLGLANSLAEEGRGKNIHVNVIAPVAASRLTETVLPPETLAALKPEFVSPLVAWLCHENCEETKSLFEVGAGYMAKLRWERSQGWAFPVANGLTVEQVASKWKKITDFAGAEHPTVIAESMGAVLNSLSRPKLGGNELIDLDEAAGDSFEVENSYSERDLSLYALGIGAARDALDASELKYVYELGKGFQAFPTYGAMPALNAYLKSAADGRGLKGFNFGLDRVLHGEQYTEIVRPLPPGAKLKNVFRFKQALDKDPHAVVTMAVDTLDEDGEKIAYNEISLFVRGGGGWGGDRGPTVDINVPPAREPDAVIEEKTDGNQTLLYRLSGDWNPLHADPVFAKNFGFKNPILHGMCTFGIVGRHVIKAFCNNDGRYFKSIKLRFAETVYPGETLVTRMWKESDTRIVFETVIKERNTLAVRNAAIELYTDIPAAKAKKQAAAAVATASAPAATVDPASQPFLPEDMFPVMRDYIIAHPDFVQQAQTVFQWNITNPDSQWVMDLKKGDLYQGSAEKADCTIELEQEVIDKMARCATLGDLQKLYFAGEIKLTGNVMASNKLMPIITMDKAAYQQAKAKRLAANGGGVVAVAAVDPASQPFLPEDMFPVMRDYIIAHPDFVQQAQTVFQWNITNPPSQWVMDLKKGDLYQGSVEKADCTIELEQEVIDKMARCATLGDLQKLYFASEIKLTGNVMASNKLMPIITMDKAAYQQAKAKRLNAATASAPSAPATKAQATPAKQKPGRAGEVFAALGKRLESQPGSASGLAGQLVQFRLRDPDTSWLLDCTGKSPRLEVGESTKATAVFSLTDDDLVVLAKGEAEVRSLFQHGQLHVDGDVRLAHQLSLLARLI